MKNKSYKHLNEHDRIRIEVWLAEGRKQTYIADKLKRNRSTISREIKNRGAPIHYFGKFAQVNYQTKRKKCHPKNRIEETEIGSYVIKKIRTGWSPEIISGRIKRKIALGVRTASDYLCSETIYQFIYNSEFGKQEKLYQYLKNGKKEELKNTEEKVKKKSYPTEYLSIPDQKKLKND